MAVNPLSIPGYAAPLDITGQLSDLTKTINNGQKMQSLAELGRGLADGTLDYKQAAAKTAALGDLGTTMSLLKLGQEQEASKTFGNSLSSLYGGQQASSGAPQPARMAVGPTVPNDSNALPGQVGMDARLADRSQDFIQDFPNTSLSSGFRTNADQQRLYADRANNSNPVAAPGTSNHERGMAVDIAGMTPEQRAMLPKYGLSQPVPGDPPHVELARNTQIASNDPAVLPANAQATQGFAVPGQAGDQGGLSQRAIQLVKLSAMPGLSAGQKDAVGKLLSAELDQSKLPDQVKQYVYARAQGYQGSLLDFKKEVASAGKTEVNILPGEKEYDKQNAKEFAEMNRKMIDGAQSARMKVSVLTRMGDLLNDPNLYTGAGGDKVLSAKRLAKAVGIDVGDLSSGEAMRAIGNQFALELRNPAGGAGMPGALSDKDREFLQASVPGLEQSREGNAKIIDYMKRVAQRSIDVERLRQDYVKKNGRLNEGFYRDLEAYSNANPLFPEADKQGAGQAAPPMQGARQAPDGNWYVQQNGKYFRVDQ